jgi:hypothetical protein
MSVALYVQAVRQLAFRLCQALDVSEGPPTWADVTEALRLLSTVVPPETVMAAVELAEREREQGGPDAAGCQNGAKAATVGKGR